MELKDLTESKLNGCLLPGYYVNEQAEFWTTRLIGINQYTPKTKEFVCYNGPLRRLKGTKHQRNKHYRLYRFCPSYSDILSEERFKNLHRSKTRHGKRGSTPRIGLQSHTVMMETFKPFEKNLPDDLVDEWPNLSPIVKRYIRSGMTVDHIDPDYTKDTFEHLSNLRWLSMSDNAIKGNK